MSLRLRNTIVIISLLLAVGVVQAAFEFDTTCTTCAKEGDVGPFIELGFSAYVLTHGDAFPTELKDQALLDRFEILEAEGTASLLRASRVTVSQGRIVEFTIDRPGSVAAESYPSVTAALAPMLLEDGSIQVNVEVATTRDVGAVRGPQGETVPITSSEVVRALPVVADAGTAAIPVTVRLTPAGDDTEPSELYLALLMSPSVIGEVAGPTEPPAGNGAGVQISVKRVKLTEGKSPDTSALSAGTVGAVAWLASAVTAGSATIINNPVMTIKSGSAATVLMHSGVATNSDDREYLESLFTFTPTVLADGRIRLVAEMAATATGARVIRHASEPLPLSWKTGTGFDVTVADGEIFLVEITRPIAGAEPGDIWFITAKTIE